MWDVVAPPSRRTRSLQPREQAHVRSEPPFSASAPTASPVQADLPSARRVAPLSPARNTSRGRVIGTPRGNRGYAPNQTVRLASDHAREPGVGLAVLVHGEGHILAFDLARAQADAMEGRRTVYSSQSTPPGKKGVP
ncbi:hypothetical protein ONZ51_g10030 [Trametes cubensis]|uniref:Uncharacterized protein n=1 Tax=Trametes cubensis TaxID=1111947 RepID=A0AAD7TLF7_9APHY|nr:hypothetical protein ONZ51_g10030 [Trametes cubensis]